MTVPQTAIVLLNWNGWQDTIDCAASLLRGSCRDFVLIICDNGSTDDSWQKLCSWCEENADCRFQVWTEGLRWDETTKIVLIQTGANLGFAGGCNVGLRFAMQQTGCEYLWLLNNDTIVDGDALRFQVQCMQRDSRIGLLGSTLIYYDEPERVQCFGGYGFHLWTARVRALPFVPDPRQPPKAVEVESRLRYVSGASTFASRHFVASVGLLNEQYFLYFEEIDWAVRGKAFRLSYCPASVVFHKEGRSIGSSRAATQRSRASELWLTRNRILFMRTYFLWRVPVAVAWVLMVALVRICTGRYRLAATLLQGVWNGLRAPIRALPDL